MWSFGILLWEIYSFGRVPYPRIVSVSHLKLPNVWCIELNVFVAIEWCPLKTWGRIPNGSTWWLSTSDLQNHDLGLVLEAWRSANFQRNFSKTGWHVLHCCMNLWLWYFSHLWMIHINLLCLNIINFVCNYLCQCVILLEISTFEFVISTVMIMTCLLQKVLDELVTCAPCPPF